MIQGVQRGGMVVGVGIEGVLKVGVMGEIQELSMDQVGYTYNFL